MQNQRSWPGALVPLMNLELTHVLKLDHRIDRKTTATATTMMTNIMMNHVKVVLYQTNSTAVVCSMLLLLFICLSTIYDSEEVRVC